MAEKKAAAPKVKRADLNTEELLEVDHIAQSLLILPRKVMDMRFPLTEFPQMKLNTSNLIEVTVVQVELFNKSKGKRSEGASGRMVRASLTFADKAGRKMYSSSFAPYQWANVYPGDKMVITTDVGYYNERAQLENPEIIDPSLIGKVSPIYPGIRSKATYMEVFNATRVALDDHLDDAADYLLASAGVRSSEMEALCGMSATQLLKEIHDPVSPEAFEKTMILVKDFSINEVLQKSERIRNRAPEKQSMLLTEPISFEGVTLTGDQTRAISEISADLRSGYAMVRLLSGDVGRGKTLPMIGTLASVWRAYNKIGQSKNLAIMLPNETLVNQVIAEFAKFFPDVKTCAVTGNTKTVDRSAVLVGTSALCFLKDYIAHLMLIDEQHKFSRDQREALCGPYTNRLEATATAIPRSIALITHGGMEVSILRESPVVKDIHTLVIDDETKFGMYQHMQEEINAGNRVLVVYPLVEESKTIDAHTVEEGFHAWREMFGDIVCMAHGKMKAVEKQAAIDAMKSGEKRVLVSSTVVEVGMDVPDINVELVIRPQRLGMNQLHQLRGRLARKGGVGTMYLYPEQEMNELEMARLAALVATNDGFEIAEKDMELRGFGDLSAESDEQKGASLVSFRGMELMPSDFKNTNQHSRKGVSP